MSKETIERLKAQIEGYFPSCSKITPGFIGRKMESGVLDNDLEAYQACQDYLMLAGKGGHKYGNARAEAEKLTFSHNVQRALMHFPELISVWRKVLTQADEHQGYTLTTTRTTDKETLKSICGATYELTGKGFFGGALTYFGLWAGTEADNFQYRLVGDSKKTWFGYKMTHGTKMTLIDIGIDGIVMAMNKNFEFYIPEKIFFSNFTLIIPSKGEQMYMTYH